MLAKRALALAILGSMLLLLNTAIILPVVSFWMDQDESIQNLTLILTRDNNILVSEDSTKHQTKELERQLRDAGILREGNSRSAVAAGIQSQVRQIIGELGGKVISTVDLPPSNDGKSLGRVGVHVNCEGDILVVVGILAASEKEKKLFFIDNTSIRAPDIIQSNNTSGKLALGFDAYGLVLSDAQ